MFKDIFGITSKIAQGTNKFGKQLPGKVSGVLEQCTASRGATSASPLENRYSGSLRLKASLSQTMSWLDGFAMLEIESDKWQRTTSQVQPIGPNKGTVFVQYKANQNFNVKLTPETWKSRIGENLKRSEQGGRYDNCVESIAYSYIVRFSFTGGATETEVQYDTIERIAADGRSKRDLIAHYKAPSMPAQFGAIGEKFLHSVSHASF